MMQKTSDQTQNLDCNLNSQGLGKLLAFKQNINIIAYLQTE
jgi:hypothetical protein